MLYEVITRLGLMDEKCPYIVPMNFGFEHTKEGRVFYFHGSGTGRKKTLLEKLEFAGFELDREIEIVESDVACVITSYSIHYTKLYEKGSDTGFLRSDPRCKVSFCLFYLHFFTICLTSFFRSYNFV